MTAGRDRFDHLFIAWRFGDPAAGLEAVALARTLVAGGLADPTLMLRVGILQWDTDRPGAERWIDRARSAGADIPRAYSRADETRAPAREDGQAQATGLDVMVVSEPERRVFPPPDGAGDHPAFSHQSPVVPALKALALANGTITVDATRARPDVYVHDGDGRLVADWSSGATPFQDQPVRVEAPLVLLDDAFSGFNVCHTLFDKFPRLALYERRFQGRRLTALMFRDHPYYREALTYLGHDMIAPDPVGRGTFGGSTTQLLSNHHRGEVRHPGFRAAPWAIDFIRDRFQSSEPGTRRLFVSRRDEADLRLVDAEAVEAVFVQRGFELVTLAGRTFVDQLALFQSAGVIAGTHGAGLANLVFASPASRVFEIMPPLAGNAAFGIMARALGQDHWVFRAEDAVFAVQPGATYDPMLTARPIRVDTVRLAADLDRFLG